ncbi:hypothetical protein CHRY9293_00292 [Chryseobacterium potabilaquae]|uniref:Uncharacterized protein n=1 Tax=Chryseobacterium potabilaquae TaxID=2675057 RepID=A0A6N4X6W5_9FLAO|nr:hypothetical protein CHRY9293_00292 [Chryseobacterium potabilaquae]
MSDYRFSIVVIRSNEKSFYEANTFYFMLRFIIKLKL